MTEQLFQNTISCPGIKLNPKLTPSQKLQNGTVPSKINTELKHFEEGYFNLLLPDRAFGQHPVYVVAGGGHWIEYTKVGHRVTISFPAISLSGDWDARYPFLNLPTRLRPKIAVVVPVLMHLNGNGPAETGAYLQIHANGDVTIGSPVYVQQVGNYLAAASVSYISEDPDFLLPAVV